MSDVFPQFNVSNGQALWAAVPLRVREEPDEEEEEEEDEDDKDDNPDDDEDDDRGGYSERASLTTALDLTRTLQTDAITEF
jgi:hypothetical protein